MNDFWTEGYPILPNTDRESSGSAWQTMPVALPWKARTWKLRIDPAAENAIVEERASDDGTTK